MEQKKTEFNQIKDIFIKILLKDGKKYISEKIFNNILINLKNKTKQKPHFILIKAIDNLAPKIKVISISNGRKHRNKNFLMFLTEEKQIKTAVTWILSCSNIKSKNIINNISQEILKTSKNKSESLKKKKKMYKEIKKLKYNIIF